jgi:hypothetical protein
MSDIGSGYGVPLDDGKTYELEDIWQISKKLIYQNFDGRFFLFLLKHKKESSFT